MDNQAMLWASHLPVELGRKEDEVMAIMYEPEGRLTQGKAAAARAMEARVPDLNLGFKRMLRYCKTSDSAAIRIR